MLEVGRFRLDLIADGAFEDEADTFVRQCAERAAPPHLKVRGKPRIKVGFNSLLVRGGGQTLVVDPGTGDKPRAELVREYHMEWPRRFLPELTALDVAPAAVDAVILTHLHWDHCGAATREDGQGRLHPVFVNARHAVQRAEWDAALSGGDGYDGRDFAPLAAAGQLELVDGDAEILPGVCVRRVGGHSAGLQIVIIGADDGSRAVYLSDLIPTAAQLPLECGLSYDVNPPELRAAKERVLTEAYARCDLLLFVHAPRARAGYLIRKHDGSFGLETVPV